MSVASAKLTAISGVGRKGPTCFLIEAGAIRLMLDLGYGPQPGLTPQVDGVGGVHALLLSHGHKDHAGSLSLLAALGDPPVYATDIVAGYLPPQIAVRRLPLNGTTDVLGITVETRRSGHAPGGVWMRFGVGAGLLYMADHSIESPVYAFGQLAPAATAIIDASYGDYDDALGEAQDLLARCVRRGPILLPVPADGRGPEIALWLARHFSRTYRSMTPCAPSCAGSRRVRADAFAKAR